MTTNEDENYGTESEHDTEIEQSAGDDSNVENREPEENRRGDARREVLLDSIEHFINYLLVYW